MVAFIILLFCVTGNLRAHIHRVHSIPVSGEQVYKCSECPCVFKKLGSLNGHMSRMHSGEDLKVKYYSEFIYLFFKTTMMHFFLTRTNFITIGNTYRRVLAYLYTDNINIPYIVARNNDLVNGRIYCLASVIYLVKNLHILM